MHRIGFSETRKGSEGQALLGLPVRVTTVLLSFYMM